MLPPISSATRMGSSGRDGGVPPSPFKKKICGDIFGTSMGGDNSMLGMLYRSRVQEKMMKNASATRRDDKLDENFSEDRLVEHTDIFDGSSDSENEVEEVINPRHRLALTIRNWSVNPINDEYLLQEGAVHALIALAGTEDHRIKQCCASALYHLSCREKNRAELMMLGSATGVITIAMSVRHWKIAKLCAQTLCNLSMEYGGESTLAKEGAVLALVILLGIRNQRLAPTCVQTLYNLTCVKENFKGMERIVKALLTLPNVSFDATPAIVGGIRNCSRFPSLRMRIIEDGVLQTFSAVINSLSHRENIVERNSIVLNISTCIAQLSDYVVCRGDMISKGAIELLQQLLPYCNEQSRLLVIKSLHNLLSMIHTSPSTIFEIGVNVVTDVINQTYDEITLQYAAACFHLFIKENMRGIPRLAVRVVKALPRLLLCSNPLTQFYSIITTSMMFFSDLIEDTSLLMVLASKAVQSGYTVRDPSSIRALVQAFAQLTQETKYIKELEKEQLLNEMLNLNLTLFETSQNDPRIMESCCVGVCRMSLQIKDKIDANRRQSIANMLNTMLDHDDSDVLCNAISSIRALLENGICHDELLSDLLITRIANITVRYSNEVQLTRVGCAVLTVLSYDSIAHLSLSSDSVLSVLFQMTRCDDILTRELVATCLCNISIDEHCRLNMIQKGIVDIIASLSGATSERIQELSAKSICNLTCTSTSTFSLHSPDTSTITSNILQTILMICLVRSVSNSTKQLCARALLNLICDENMDQIIESGVIRAFSTMSLLDDSQTQYICARGFLMLSSSEKGRQTIVMKRSILQSLFSLVKAYSGKTRVLMGMAIFNLLTDPTSRESVIRAGALSVLKIIATLEYENLREGTARVIIILAQSQSSELERYILREPIVPVLVLITKTSSKLAFECSLMAFSCLSQSKSYRKTLIEKGCISALVGAVVDGKVNTVELTQEICRCFCLLSLSKDYSEDILETEHIMLALHLLHKQKLLSLRSGEMIGMLLRNLSCTSRVCRSIVEQDGLYLLSDLMRAYAMRSNVLISSAMLLFHNLGKDYELHERLIEEEMMGMIRTVTEIDESQRYQRQRQKRQRQGQRQRGGRGGEGEGEGEGEEGGDVDEELSMDDTLRGDHERNSNNISNSGVDSPLTPATHRPSFQNNNTTLPPELSLEIDQGATSSTISTPQPRHTEEDIRATGGTAAGGEGGGIGGGGVRGGGETGEEIRRTKLLSQDTIYDIVMAIQLVSLTPDCRELIVNGQVVKIFLSVLSSGLNDVVRHEMVCALNNLASSRECREELVAQGAIDLLVNLAQSPYADTQAQCSTALGHLSENTQVKSGTVASLLLLALKAEDLKDSSGGGGGAGGGTRRASSITGLETSAAVTSSTTGVSATAAGGGGGGGGGVSGSTGGPGGGGAPVGGPVVGQARELLALQSVKSLRVMIRDGLLRKREKHGILIGEGNEDGSDAASTSGSITGTSINSFRGISLEDLNEVGYLHLTSDEQEVISRDYSQYEYLITYHPVSHELGGMSTQMKVDLPYPTVSMRDVEKDDRTGDLIEIKISEDALEKNKAETKIHELTRYASTANDSEAMMNDEDDLHRGWSTSNANGSGNGRGTSSGGNGNTSGHRLTGTAAAGEGGGEGTGGGGNNSMRKKKKSKGGGRGTLNHAKSVPEGHKIWKEAGSSGGGGGGKKEPVNSPTNGNGSRREGTS